MIDLTTADVERHVRELETYLKVDEELAVKLLGIWLNTFEEKKK